MRYDAAIIGAGAEGLAAAALLAKAGVKTIVVERSERAGGRAATREFHPGFWASPFADELAPIPVDIYSALDLARRGAIFAPPPSSLAVWPDRQNVLRCNTESPASRLLASAEARAAAIRVRAAYETDHAPRRSLFSRPSAPSPWPGEDWMSASIADVLDREIGDTDSSAHVAAMALAGAATDPFLSGSALYLLASRGSGTVIGGLARLADVLAGAARDAGAEVSLGLDVTDIRHTGTRVTGIGLADGTEIEARAVISTLDLKRTFLSFFQWNALPKEVVQSVSTFRMAGSMARVLFALDAAPKPAAFGRAPIHVAPGLESYAHAYAAWRSGMIADVLPTTLRIVSASDPGLAPVGTAVVTATLGAVPFRLFDGAWTREKRQLVRARATTALEAALTGVSAHIVASDVIVPPDIEEALGATEGDLRGGELAADQTLSAGPWPEFPLPRTPLKGLYLAGSWLAMSATCTAGAATARTVAADLVAGKLK